MAQTAMSTNLSSPTRKGSIGASDSFELEDLEVGLAGGQPEPGAQQQQQQQQQQQAAGWLLGWLLGCHYGFNSCLSM